MISQFMVAAACCFYQFLVLSFYSFHTCIMNIYYDTFLEYTYMAVD